MIAVPPCPKPEPGRLNHLGRLGRVSRIWSKRPPDSVGGRYGVRIGSPTWFVHSISIPVVLAAVLLADPTVIHIHRGDTLWGLSRQYHTTVAELKRLNHLPSDTIYAGSTLLVPAPGNTSGHTSGPATYRVRSGDTAGQIALDHHVSLRRLAELNGLHGRMVIHPGQVLRLPEAGQTGYTPPHRHYPRAVTASAARHRAELARRPHPSVEQIRQLVVRTARDLGLDPALALAVARQESGLHMNVVSEADAIGVMQVLPSTGRWLSRDVVHQDLDLLEPRDNVLAGVALLRLLTRSAPLRHAIAGYYQGLASVRAHGMYPDTVRYVANVLALRDRSR
jgi:Soluble lytic murein transglycosylase and related regulatory proteins (some contain LysM/invasin domains)